MSIGPGTSKTRFISKYYPVISGLIAETTKQEGRQVNLVAKKGSLVPKRLKIGLGY